VDALHRRLFQHGCCKSYPLQTLTNDQGIIFRSSSKRRRLIFSWENVSQLTPQTKAAASAWDMVTDVSEKYKDYKSQKASDADPLLPPGKTPGGKFGGFGFGKQGEKAAGLRGYTISKPVESLPRECLMAG
jgi:hypothetical protein